MPSGGVCHVFQRLRWPTEREGAQRGLIHCLSRSQNPTGFGDGPVTGWLVGLNGQHRGEDFRLGAGSHTLGSGLEADLVVTSPGISGRHMAFQCSSTTCFVEHIALRGDLLVNGEKTSKSSLVDGDEVQAGDVRFLFRKSTRFEPGYEPTYRSRQRPAAAQSTTLRHFTCGWLVGVTGLHAGHDFRLINAENRIGTHADLEVTLIGSSLLDLHACISWTENRLMIRSAVPEAVIIHDGQPLLLPQPLRDSETIVLGSDEYFIKCL